MPSATEQKKPPPKPPAFIVGSGGFAPRTPVVIGHPSGVGVTPLNNNLSPYCPSGDAVGTGCTSPSGEGGAAVNNNLPQYAPSGDAVGTGCTSPSGEGGAAVNNNLLPNLGV